MKNDKYAVVESINASDRLTSQTAAETYDLTAEGAFTDGVEGPAVDMHGNEAICLVVLLAPAMCPELT